jgi:hypothetical protein
LSREVLGTPLQDLGTRKIELSAKRREERDGPPPRFDQCQRNFRPNDAQWHPRDPCTSPDIRHHEGSLRKQAKEKQRILEELSDDFGRRQEPRQALNTVPDQEQVEITFESPAFLRGSLAPGQELNGPRQLRERITPTLR